MLGVTLCLAINPSADQTHPGSGFAHGHNARSLQLILSEYSDGLCPNGKAESPTSLRHPSYAQPNGLGRAVLFPPLPGSPMTHTLSPDTGAAMDIPQDALPPACVLCFNANDPSGAGGVGGDMATIAAMGAHALPVITTLLLRDTAEIFDQHPIDAEVIVEQARNILEDVTLSGFKVGFLGSAENISAVAEILSDYAEVPVVSYLPNLSWMDDDAQQSYLEAFRELILPATEVLIGNHKTLTDFLLPDWESDRPASPRELAVAAAERGTPLLLVTGVMLPLRGAGATQFIDNVLASAQGAITGEKFELFEVGFIGAGETLSAAMAALLSVGSEVHAAVGEALQFLDQSLDAGFRPGMGNVIPDRFFWAIPPEEEGLEGEELLTPDAANDPPNNKNGGPRRVH